MSLNLSSGILVPSVFYIGITDGIGLTDTLSHVAVMMVVPYVVP